MYFSSSNVLFASLVSLIAVNSVTATTFSTNTKIDALTEQQVLAIAPNSADCTKASFPDECTNATVATEQLNKAFKAYKVWSLGPKAALASLIAFESGDFVYNINHFPGRPGQGSSYNFFPGERRIFANKLNSQGDVDVQMGLQICSLVRV
jgi:hypothetical protein